MPDGRQVRRLRHVLVRSARCLALSRDALTQTSCLSCKWSFENTSPMKASDRFFFRTKYVSVFILQYVLPSALNMYLALQLMWPHVARKLSGMRSAERD